MPAACCTTAAAAESGLLLLVMGVSGGLNGLQVDRLSQTLRLSFPVAVRVRVVAAAASVCCCYFPYCCCCCVPAAVLQLQVPLLYDTLTLTSVSNADYNSEGPFRSRSSLGTLSSVLFLLQVQESLAKPSPPAIQYYKLSQIRRRGVLCTCVFSVVVLSRRSRIFFWKRFARRASTPNTRKGVPEVRVPTVLTHVGTAPQYVEHSMFCSTNRNCPNSSAAFLFIAHSSEWSAERTPSICWH